MADGLGRLQGCCKVGIKMIKMLVPMLSLVAITGCGGAPAGWTGETETDTDTATSSSQVPTDISNDLDAYSYKNGTLTLTGLSLDSTPEAVTYARTASLDVDGFSAYTLQEDPLDRLFIGLAGRSSDGVVSAVVAGDGGQFNRVFNGALYERSGNFDAPTIGSGPGAGQVSYAGQYAGLWNGGVNSSSSTSVLLPVPSGTDSSLIPSQAARVQGDVFLNANFQDATVNGSIYNRTLVDYDAALPNVVLVPTTILDNGTFEGGVEYEDETGNGTYAGLFGGTDSRWVAGGVSLTDADPDVSNEIERGVFILEQCNTSSAAICDDVAQ
jgi:hypothetical protein